MTVHMETVTLVDTAPGVRELEWALQATCGALVTEDLFQVRGQITDAIEAIRAALRELRPGACSAAQAVVSGFVLAADQTEVYGHPAPPVS
jgi:hypothetical protein